MSYSRPVSAEAEALHADAIVIDATSFFLEGPSSMLETSGITALNLTVPDIEDDTGGALRKIASHYQLAREFDELVLVEQADDIVRAKQEGKVGMIVGAQNARHMSSRYGLVEVFYRAGMRVSQVAYNDRSFAADGCATNADAGLSLEGRELVREMNRVGMVVDVTHVGARSAAEAVEASEKPPIASHSNPYNAAARVPRNVSDELIKAIADKGGVVGHSPFPSLLWNGADARPSIDDFFDAVEHTVKLVGVDHIGIGTDKEASPGAYPREVRLRLGKRFAHATQIECGVGFREKFPTEGSPTIDGFESLADFPVITQGLLSRGFSDEDVRKILGLNFLRVFRETWTVPTAPAAEKLVAATA